MKNTCFSKEKKKKLSVQKIHNTFMGQFRRTPTIQFVRNVYTYLFFKKILWILKFLPRDSYQDEIELIH